MMMMMMMMLTNPTMRKDNLLMVCPTNSENTKQPSNHPSQQLVAELTDGKGM
jgi:hypothetical protein